MQGFHSGEPELQKSIIVVLLATALIGCNEGSDSHKAIPQSEVSAAGVEASTAPEPGYLETKAICTQCHAMPVADQFHPAAWPSVVARMEAHMRSNNKILPSDQERTAILAYLQNNKGWK